jgi:hypothetical protein
MSPVTNSEQVARELYLVLDAHETVLREKHGRRVPAHYTRRAIANRGGDIIAAADYSVSRGHDTGGFLGLVERFGPDMTFEAVVLKYQDHFTPKAVARATKRLEGHTAATVESS